MQIFELIQYLEQIAPLSLQESYDNCGLLVGDAALELSGALITLDVTAAVIHEAIEQNCNLVICHHPIIFKGLKKLTPYTYVERTIIKAIQHNIAIYAIHTNLDNIWNGVNQKIASKLDLINTSILQIGTVQLAQLTTYVPATHTDIVLEQLFKVGAGAIANYDSCVFKVEGMGQFRPLDDAKPYLGAVNTIEKVKEERIEIVFPSYLKSIVEQTLKKHHPYEEVAYTITLTTNNHPQIGAGRVGYLKTPMMPLEFIHYLKAKLNVSMVRATSFVNKPISKVALCGGSGSFLLANAKQVKADIYISSDFKYHEFFDADDNTMIADINHYEAEFFTKELIFEHLNQKFTNIALVLSNINTNPIICL